MRRTSADNIPDRGIVRAFLPLDASKSIPLVPSLQPVVEAVPILLIGGRGRTGNVAFHAGSSLLSPTRTHLGHYIYIRKGLNSGRMDTGIPSK